MTFMKRTAATAPAAGSGRNDSRLFLEISRNILQGCNILEPDKLIREIRSTGLRPQEMAAIFGKIISGAAKPTDHAFGNVPIPTADALRALPDLLAAGLRPQRILSLIEGILKSGGGSEGATCLRVFAQVAKQARQYLTAAKVDELFSRLVANRVVNDRFFMVIPSGLEAGLSVDQIIAIGSDVQGRINQSSTYRGMTAFFKNAPKRFDPVQITKLSLEILSNCEWFAGTAFIVLEGQLDKMPGMPASELADIISDVIKTANDKASGAVLALPAVLEADLNRQEIKNLFEVIGKKENQDEATSGFESLSFAIRAARSVLSVNAAITLLTDIAKEAKEMTPYAYAELPEMIKEGQGSEEIIRWVKDAWEYYMKSELQGSDDFLEILRPNREDRF